MPVVVSLLRGINVGGRNKIRMASLRELYASRGFRDARTLLQSGNAIFETDEPDLARVGERIQAGVHESFSLDIQVIMRSAAEFESIFARHPFSADQLRESNKAVVVFLSDSPAAQAVEQLRAGNPGREIIQAEGRELFVFFAAGQARSKLTNSRIESALDRHSTARNWNSCLKLRELLKDFEA